MAFRIALKWSGDCEARHRAAPGSCLTGMFGAFTTLGARSPPVLWDADFLCGPRTAPGEDSHVLCEIHVSAVSPFPSQAAPEVTRLTLRRLKASMQ